MRKAHFFQISKNMKAFYLLSVLGFCVSTSLAATYTWTNGGGDNIWSNSNNWDLNNGYFPQSQGDIAVIGENKGTIKVTANDYFFVANTLSVGAGTTIDLAASGDINIPTINLSGKIVATSDAARGIGYATTINYGTITGDNLIDVSTSSTFWTNGHPLTFTGLLDLSNSSPTSYDLFIYGGLHESSIIFDASGIVVKSATKESTQLTQAANNTTYEDLKEGQFSVIDDNHHIQVIYKDFQAVPEPATATLGLLGLSALLLRRRRSN